MEISSHLFVSIIILTALTTYIFTSSYTPPVFYVDLHPLASNVHRCPVRPSEQPEPKIVYKSLDEPRMRYPKFASDDLTDFLLNTSDECGEENALDAVIIVHTSAGNFARRNLIRAYSNYTLTNPYKLKVVFLIGQTLDAILQIKLEQENMKYGDTVVGVFMDTYQNLTLKAVMGYRWLAETCKQPQVVIKMDDDVLFDAYSFFDYWKTRTFLKRTISCLVWKKAKVRRGGKWNVEKSLFPNATYDFPYCAGFVSVVTADIIKDMYNTAKSTDFFWIDDVFMYGMVPNIMQNVEHININNEFIFYKMFNYNTCKKKDNCKAWGALTRSEKELKQGLDIIHKNRNFKRILQSNSSQEKVR